MIVKRAYTCSKRNSAVESFSWISQVEDLRNPRFSTRSSSEFKETLSVLMLWIMQIVNESCSVVANSHVIDYCGCTLPRYIIWSRGWLRPSEGSNSCKIWQGKQDFCMLSIRVFLPSSSFKTQRWRVLALNPFIAICNLQKFQKYARVMKLTHSAFVRVEVTIRIGVVQVLK